MQFDSQLSRMNCQIFSTGLSSGHFVGSADDADVVGHVELSGGVPSGLVHQHDRMGFRRDDERYAAPWSRCCRKAELQT
jgi:hypothetical protein